MIVEKKNMSNYLCSLLNLSIFNNIRICTMHKAFVFDVFEHQPLFQTKKEKSNFESHNKMFCYSKKVKKYEL